MSHVSAPASAMHCAHAVYGSTLVSRQQATGIYVPSFLGTCQQALQDFAGSSTAVGTFAQQHCVQHIAQRLCMSEYEAA